MDVEHAALRMGRRYHLKHVISGCKSRSRAFATRRGLETFCKFNYALWMESDGHCLSWWSKKFIKSPTILASWRAPCYINIQCSFRHQLCHVFGCLAFGFQSHDLTAKINFRNWNINSIALIVLFLSLHVTRWVENGSNYFFHVFPPIVLLVA